ncbi:hypothetical protein [Sulfobacillus harzensis]|uniref:hypothetical protein n=1 Tax=Sulfobacillus harzensis TaxID=2729629 RepID=UPI001FAC5A02|nr:hypothetical protein [Sulfobacillus harzensis]
MVSPGVQTALKEGRFHLWAVDTIEQGIEVLTGVPAGTPNDGSDTVMGSVAKRLEQFADIEKQRQSG